MPEPLKVLTSRTLVLTQANIDTDQIIPARFLTTTETTGLGAKAFYDWRYEADGSARPEAVLNRIDPAEHRILVAGDNFGCGSSREHAPWALHDYGFRAVISTAIADIFTSNALKNGFLPVVVDQATWEDLVANPEQVVTIDLEAGEVRRGNHAPVGFSVDLMRAICERMAVACTIQARRFDTLLQTLAEGQADIVAAAIPVTAALKSRFHVSRIYHRLPARFVGAAGCEPARVEAGLAGVRVAVVRETAHAAYLAEYFPKAVATGAADLEAALQQLQRGDVDLVFGDGQAAALWLGGRSAAGFRFIGGPFLSKRYFGEGIGFVLRPDEPNLKRAVDHALQGLWDDGTYARLFLRYFPVSAF